MVLTYDINQVDLFYTFLQEYKWNQRKTSGNRLLLGKVICIFRNGKNRLGVFIIQFVYADGISFFFFPNQYAVEKSNVTSIEICYNV